MTAIAMNVISLYNNLPDHEREEVLVALNKNDALRTELNYELKKAKKSKVLSDNQSNQEWRKLGVNVAKN
jgi:ABC-type amino acid transport substrate-binding protein